ncbi:unnamed protein product [Schistocephalus solidus]|uniref:C2H2-type domain-containing protein n=1 Tax=Schistocephalus solidus TaxID=70667 RepID=A0A183SUA5_SCHSO|nr:unnamed protein product [Schistocephalus solidus]
MTSGFPVTTTLSVLPTHFKRLKEVEQTEGSLFQNLFSTLETFRTLHNIYKPAETVGNESPSICRIGPALVQPQRYPSLKVTTPIYQSPSQTLAYQSVADHSSLIASYSHSGFRETRPPNSSPSLSTDSSLSSAFPLSLDNKKPVGEAELREFVCRLCGQSFKCALHLAQHHCPDIVQTTYNCCECEKHFGGKSVLYGPFGAVLSSRFNLPVICPSTSPCETVLSRQAAYVGKTSPEWNNHPLNLLYVEESAKNCYGDRILIFRDEVGNTVTGDRRPMRDDAGKVCDPESRQPAINLATFAVDYCPRRADHQVIKGRVASECAPFGLSNYQSSRLHPPEWPQSQANSPCSSSAHIRVVTISFTADNRLVTSCPRHSNARQRIRHQFSSPRAAVATTLIGVLLRLMGHGGRGGGRILGQHVRQVTETGHSKRSRGKRKRKLMVTAS